MRVQDAYKPSRLARLPAASYQGRVAVHWSMTTQNRATGWLGDLAHSIIREALLQMAVRDEVWCPAYCLMPDHAHFLWIGVNESADQLSGVKFFRRLSNECAPGLVWQKQAYDHVLRRNEASRSAIASVCSYVFENPVRAGLVRRKEDYLFSGSCVPGCPDLVPWRGDFWDVFWAVYWRGGVQRRALTRAVAGQREE